MKSNKVKLIVLFSILAIAISALAVGNLMARPSSQTAGSVSFAGGAVAGTFFSDKAGFNVVTVKVVDADLSPQRVGSARFTGQAPTGGTVAAPFNLTSTGGTGAVIGGEKDNTQKFTGDGSSKVFPLTTVTPTAADFNARPVGAPTTGGVQVLALGRTAIDRNGSGLSAADVYTGSSASNVVNGIVASASTTTTTTADSVSIVGLAVTLSGHIYYIGHSHRWS